ncbi:potassium-transporting ATPase subunit KdpA [Methanocorpusculum vombati]|uniref:Multifunctional fusion protein n=1 Tax=Methanocorpusculum vombati TaxID=3002864 RepID=A0ABT4IJ07_9EURY|nr:potassium-transporting ATPase subunit KdpA [Methanocorpusculum vombati]MCZ9319136.1 potassium-transporting ATPase subunit KdpA [Methanocorpusculum sp.]MCZ0861719.1 potassium-transporting ATPase subunit KdpA [Methanocorpusculum vombati]MDE2520121.1 potassium-transporting ATPase subunit KdpA [Methanocorpusculum sp.]MDE2535048.1 potassium-transporting ATPase subunit KdpA [Methanocorpusculum sp.]MDE2547594.1 potassium-transporting ATPase subunit KdpA [Methanocorpusculum sp.]
MQLKNETSQKILRQIKPAIVLLLILTLLTGLVYPLLITGVSQVVFPAQANGGLISENGTYIGSELIGQEFTDPKYFWGRPSATSPAYNASLGSGSNLGPTNPALEQLVADRIAALQAANPGNTAAIPVELVTASASGLDPHISPAAAYYQIARVAEERGISEGELIALVNGHIEDRQFGILGEPRINVLKLNLALDAYVPGTLAAEEQLPADTGMINGVRGADIAQFAVFFVILAVLVVLVGRFMAKIYKGEKTFLSPIYEPVERYLLKIAGVKGDEEQDWKSFAASLLIFNAFGLGLLYLLQRVQQFLPLNPLNLAGVSPDLAFNTAVSFTTNTNWQAYSGEVTLSYLTQMLGLTVQNFLSAATGMAVVIALIFALTRKNTHGIGNFWVLLLRSLWILIPIAVIISMLLVSQGTIQTLGAPAEIELIDPVLDENGSVVADTQVLAMAPVASQAAIKFLGTNGGGVMGVNSAHPFENPTPLSNLVEILAMILIPAALCYTFGSMIGSVRKGIAVLLAMAIIFVPFLGICYAAEFGGNPMFTEQGADQIASALQPGGNMEGKEVRFGLATSTLFAVVTTSTSCGGVNSMHDSYTPVGGMIPLLLMQLGEIVFGGVGSGLYVMLVFVILAMFIAGLMVGRTPEFLGKKIEPKDMKLASLIILIPPCGILIGTAVSAMIEPGVTAILNPGAHGLSEIMYAFSSAIGNNGSAFGGLGVNTVYYNIALGIAMLVGRFAIIVPVLALAGSLAAKKIVPPSDGTLQPDRPLFVIWLVFVILMVGVLSFLPALALGPIAEHLIMIGGL